jgi:hypothetical protein
MGSMPKGRWSLLPADGAIEVLADGVWRAETPPFDAVCGPDAAALIRR